MGAYTSDKEQLFQSVKYLHPQLTFHESDLTRSTYSQSGPKGLDSLRDLVSIVWSYAHGWPSWYTETMCRRKFETYSLPSLVRWMSEGLCIGLSNWMSHRKVPLGLKIWKLLENFINNCHFLWKSYSKGINLLWYMIKTCIYSKMFYIFYDVA